MLALPLRHGGLGIQNQNQDLSNVDKSQISKTKADLKLDKEMAYTAEKNG